jgi:hypothetical protein
MLGLLAIVGYLFLTAPLVHAEPTLGLQPLQYTETLKKGERKKAFIDITNPSSQPATVQFTSQAFRQVDDKGTLSFYDDDKIRSGILLDYSEMEIPAKKTLRLYFIVDGAKLPTGDVFAVIFAQTKPVETTSVPAVRVGTLLILTNGTPGARQATVESLTTPLLQIGDRVTGEIKIKNTAPASTASGFFPQITISMWPFGPSSTVTGPLIYAGNTRTIVLDQPSSQLGIYKLRASYGSSYKDHWVILITGVWRWGSLGIIAAIILVSLFYKIVYKKFLNKRP